MRHLIAIATLASTFVFASRGLAAAPQITGLSSPSIARNGKIVLSGSSFGPAPALSPDARVEIGGVHAATAAWSDGRIVAYPTESMPPGATTLRVVTSDGASADHPITLVDLPAAQGKVAWKIQSDMGAFRRPTVGADGTVYAADTRGFVYALAPSGLVRWIYDGVRRGGHADGFSDEGPISVGADGTVYVAIDPVGPDIQLHAIHPDGTTRWVLAESWAAVVSGPNVGPEGDVYFATTVPGYGMQRISPLGTRIWTHPGAPKLDDAHYERSMDIAFGPAEAQGAADQLYFAVALDDIYAGDPSPPMLYGYGIGGAHRFARNVGSLSGSFGGRRGQVSVGANGAVYLSSWYHPESWAVHAYDPSSGSKLWSWKASPGNDVSAVEPGADGTLYLAHDGAYLTALDQSGAEVWEMTMGGYHANEAPVLSPDGRVLLVDNSKSDNGLHGAIAAFSAADGTLRFRIDLPKENGTWQSMLRRARFAPSGGRAYVSTGFGGQPAGEEYGYLWALDVGAEEPGSSSSSSSSSGSSSSGAGEGGGAPTSSGGTGGTGTGGETSTGGQGGANEGEGTSAPQSGCSTSRGAGADGFAALAALAAAAWLRRRRSLARVDM